ncbi:MAG TPA: response regulator, partial [Gemmatimonadales bacterium]
MGHLVLAPIVGLMVWDGMPHTLAIAWISVVALAALIRGIVVTSLRREGAPPERIRLLVRTSVALLSLSWGAGGALAAQTLPAAEFAMLLVVFSGLISVGSFTLLSDPVSLRLLVGAIGLPLVGGVLIAGFTPIHYEAAAFVVAFMTMMLLISRRRYAALVQSVRTAKRLEFSEQETARERSFLEALLASAPNAIVAVSRHGRVLGVNDGFERIFGYSSDEVVGQNLNDLIVPERFREQAEEMDQEVKKGASMVVDLERRRKDGSTLIVRTSAALVKGLTDGGLFIIYDDVTALRRADELLHEAETQYRELVESASDLVWRMDAEGRWTYLNSASERVYGTKPESLIGQLFIERVDPMRREDDQRAFQRVLAGGEIVDYETTHRDVHGAPRILSFAARPVRNAAGVIVGAHGTGRDVSERAAARAALQAARDEAERVGGVKSAFLANMSHEIRTPMNGILGMTEILLDGDLSAEQRRSAELVKVSAESLLLLINDILDFSKIEAGRLTLERAGFDLHGLLASTVRLMSTKHGVELIADVAKDVPRRVLGDPGRVRQVLNNLLGNAVKFTAAGEVVLTARTAGTGSTGPMVRIGVRDTGIGIAKEKLGAVFEDFTQADLSTTRKYGGTGLGLAISRRLVQQMGGDLGVTSELGKGSEFAFTIPVDLDPAPETVAVTGAVSLEGYSVLVAEDNPTNRRVVRDALAPLGGVVDEAESGTDALTKLREQATQGAPYRLAIVDASLPYMDGFMVAAAMERDPDLAGTAVMMLTSAGQRGDGQRCRELGIAAYMTKPVSASELTAAVQAIARRGSGDSGELITRHSILEARGGRLKVLLAEDNPINQEVATAMLRRRGHDVTVVGNGVEAVSAAKGTRFDVVLMDIQMPELDGMAAMGQIRQTMGAAAPPIIALTAHAMAGERERCLTAGFDGYLAKPFRPEDLFVAVETGARPAEPVSAPRPSGQLSMKDIPELAHLAEAPAAAAPAPATPPAVEPAAMPLEAPTTFVVQDSGAEPGGRPTGPRSTLDVVDELPGPWT